MRTKIQSRRMAVVGAVGCFVLLGALWWFTPPKPTGCSQHLTCPPTARRCYVDATMPGGQCVKACESDADCGSGCCRASAVDGALACAPERICQP